MFPYEWTKKIQEMSNEDMFWTVKLSMWQMNICSSSDLFSWIEELFARFPNKISFELPFTWFGIQTSICHCMSNEGYIHPPYIFVETTTVQFLMLWNTESGENLVTVFGWYMRISVGMDDGNKSICVWYSFS